MKVAFQMEALAETDREATNSLIMIQEACRRGYEVFHYLPEHLSMDNERVFTRAARVSVDLSREQYYELGPYEHTDLTGFDVVFLRQHPPFDMNYITPTYMLDHLQKAGVLVTNNSFWVRNTPEKLCIFEFKKYIAPTLVTRDWTAAEEFMKRHGEVVIKPLYSFFGHGIIKTSSLEEAKEKLESSPDALMFQIFIDEIREGNTRAILFDGEIVGTRRTLPAEGRFNTHEDHTHLPHELSAHERAMCADIGQTLKERGLHFVGIDIIGSYLTEINVTCTGTLNGLNRIYGKKYEALLWDMIEKKAQAAS